MSSITLLGKVGKICAFSGTDDDGQNFSAYWRSKDLDFSEELGPEAHEALKTIDKVALLYEDIDSDAPITVSVSTDGGTTWTSKSAIIGSGTNASRRYEFDYCPTDAVTGHFLTFKVNCPTSDKSIKWTALSIDVILRGIKTLVGED